MSSRREALEWNRPSRTTNAGLWLDKYLDSSGADDSKAKHNLIKDVAGIAVPDSYRAFYKRWRVALEQQDCKPREVVIIGRMALGLGDESVLETSITLHHIYGVPYIPGSALKGLAASYARQQLEGEEWSETGKHYLTVFGDTDNAGFITFYDALFIPPEPGNKSPLAVDVLTVHHPKYYQNTGEPPADWDDPVPIPFLSATGRYLLALGGPAEWVELAFQVLGMALRDAGVGAKTSSGYGRARIAKPRPTEETVKQGKDKAKGARLSKPTEAEEEVILESDARNRRAQVRVSTGEIITCGSFPPWPVREKGEKCRALVSRRDGTAISAIWVR
jgi:CRISPR-associated protein Cmr6